MENIVKLEKRLLQIVTKRGNSLLLIVFFKDDHLPNDEH